MKTRVYYEKRKILKRKSTVIACILLLLFMIGITLLLVSDESYYLPDGTEITGIKAIRMQEKMTHSLAGDLTPERVKEVQLYCQTVYNTPGNTDDVGNLSNEAYSQYIQPYNDILMFLLKIYSPAGMNSYDYRVITNTSDGDAERIHDLRHERVVDVLNMDYTQGNFTPAEKDAVLQHENKISEPFTFDYTGGWSALLSRAFPIVFLLICIAICVIISPVFAIEYQTGTDVIILSSKYGRSSTVYAKIIAGLEITSGIYLIAVLACCVSMLCAFSIRGWNCEYQILAITSFWGLKIWQVVAYGIVINYITILSVAAFVMLLSAYCKTPFAAVILSTICTIVPIFIPSSVNSKLFNQILSLLPAQAMNIHSVFSSYTLFKIGKMIIPLPHMIVCTSMLLIVLMLPVAYRRFCRHQVV